MRNDSTRHGSVLLAVLVIVAMLSLGAYTFSEIMVTEAEATSMFGRAVQSRLFADSAIDTVIAVLASPDLLAEVDLYNDPDLFQDYLVRDATSTRSRGHFSVVAPVESDDAAQQIRFGLIDESSKINLNAILSYNLSDTEVRELLLNVPDMTEETADAILDWLDEDDQTREFGAESDYYQSMTPPYEAKNGPFESLDELLLVAGVTPELLYGEDANRNGLLDSCENDGDQSPPVDNSDGLLQLGWDAYLTVYSRESNLRADGSERVNLNQSDLTQLYDALETEFDADTARFVVAYRLYGAVSTSTEGSGTSTSSMSGGSGTNNVSERSTQQAQAAGSQLGQALFGGGSGNTSVTRGGMDLSGGAQVEIKSVFDLVGVQVQAQVDGASTQLESPWSANAGDMESYLPDLLDTVTTVDGDYREGTINLNQARREVLLGVPGMTEDLAATIAAAQAAGSSGASLSQTTGTRATIGWLVIEGYTDIEQLRTIAPYLTTRGGVFRAQVIGYFEQGGPFTRLNAVIDATARPPRILGLQDLIDLGKGYSRQQFAAGM